MDKSSKIISSLFLVGGIGIIIAIFFLFLKDCQEEKLFYLNLVVSCLIYSVIFIRSFDIFGTVEQVAASSSGYGIKWYGVWFYTPIAIALVIASIILEWQFDYCLIGHLILLFILFMFFFLGSITKKNVNEVMGNIEARKSGLKDIANQLSLLEMNCKMSNGTEYLDSVNSLREAVRYITASDSQMAKTLEEKLSLKIQLIASQVEHSSQPADVINAEFKDCMSLVELRKNQY